jgi:hypothetical protein
MWQADRIARIHPDTGQVIGWINLTGILPLSDRTKGADVLNGIAYHPQAKQAARYHRQNGPSSLKFVWLAAEKLGAVNVQICVTDIVTLAVPCLALLGLDLPAIEAVLVASI